tara:strand:- start:252 stop:2054 length:1803 start_codon:yes stop_codon:yes gene_type:complete
MANICLESYNNYIIFIEKNKICSFCKTTAENIKKEFKKKCIDIILINDLSEISNFKYNNKPVFYDNLEYPTLGKLYILFDTKNFDNIQNVKYYSIHLHLFKMKAFIHNFLIFLSQSLGAKNISWNCNIEHLTSSNTSISGTTSSNNVDVSAGISQEETTKNNISNDLRLTYDNNGTELFFSTINYEKSWGVKICQLLKNPSVSSFDIVRYKRNDIIIENFLKNNRYFSYEFYKNNDFLIDFVRKRQNSMTSIHHEILFDNNHKTMFNYYNNLGSKYLGNLGFEYINQSTETYHDKTIYNVVFYSTNDLEKTTIKNIVEEKSVGQMLRETKDIINNIETTNSELEFKGKYEYYILYVVFQKYKHYIDLFEIKKESKKTFFEKLLKKFGKIIAPSKESAIIRFFLKTHHEFLMYIINNILNSIHIEESLEKLIDDAVSLAEMVEEQDQYIDIKYIVESQFYNKDNQNILEKNFPDKFKKYQNKQNIEENKKKNEIYKNTTSIDLINKEDGNNYANCDGRYVLYISKKVNGQGVYINEIKNRFIGYSAGTWILTGIQWLENIIEESKNLNNHGFGGFHASISKTEVPIALSKWSEYYVEINNI